MKAMLDVRQLSWAMCTSLALIAACVPVADAKDSPPEVSPDGLHLQKSSKNRLVYLKSGATFSQYDRVAILDCYVEFAKDWQRNYNMNEPDLEMKVSKTDMDRIQRELAAEFKRVFTEELQTKGGFEIVDIAAPDVLILRPALLNLMVNAPEIDTAPTMAFAVVSSAGQMTLYLELWDSTTNKILARVVDTEADNSSGGFAQAGGVVRNKEAADEMLASWADRLRTALDNARNTATSAATTPTP
jgi:hypothetical protein